jgi:teichuronic acid biosynthesis glycosyltransferase TuaC
VRILTFTTLYPNAAQPRHGVFVEQRLRQLLAAGGAEARVVAPVPWFPWRHARFGRYAEYAAVPAAESRHGIRIAHPRFASLPKVGMSLAPALLARTAVRALRAEQADGYDFDVIDAHYFYPDGVAAVMAGESLGRPVVVTARGTDINLFPRFAGPRRWILWAARRAAAVVTVCQALKDRLIELGVPAARITVLRNGVDRERFAPRDRAVERGRLGLEGLTLLSVGNLIPLKGHDIAIRALAGLEDARLLIVGDGPERNRLRELAGALGVGERVRFVGPVPQEELPRYYSAADMLVLASSREGMANVLLEAMACGTPVVATAVGGTPEVVAAPEAGVLMTERSPSALVAAVRALQARYPDRAAVRRHTEAYGWDQTSRGQLELFRRVIQTQGET